ncbi:phage holin family protein [Paenibacillus oryzae]|uniref:phage holin family protein n=1 Tax=Paenibacillus oryzae TaxID=1844972 RepID=UPI0009EF6DB8
MEALAKITIAAGGAVASYLFGGWSIMLSILLTFVIIDYCTGLAAAAKEGKLRSDVGLWGIAKKVMIFGIVTVAHLIDTALGEAHLFRDTAIFFYLSNELLSLIENAGRIGAPIPPALQRAVEVLKSKSGDNPFNVERYEESQQQAEHEASREVAHEVTHETTHKAAHEATQEAAPKEKSTATHDNEGVYTAQAHIEEERPASLNGPHMGESSSEITSIDHKHPNDQSQSGEKIHDRP